MAVTNIQPPNPVVLEARKKFNLHMEDELLDYKHNHAMHIDNCATMLIKIFNNVLDNPAEDKYRKVCYLPLSMTLR